MEYQYDVAIIGSGPGGYAAAIRARQQGLTTILIEKENVGGTCLNRGCIPAKAMLHAGEVMEEIKHADHIGIKVENLHWDLRAFYSRKDQIVKKLRKGIKKILESNEVVVETAVGSFENPHKIILSNDQGVRAISARKVIIATGSEPIIPPIPGLEGVDYWTNRTLLEENPQIPDKMVIVGGGVVGVEFAYILNDLGAEVALVEMFDQLLPSMDFDSAQLLRKEMESRGIKIFVNSKLDKIQEDGKELICSLATNDNTQGIRTEKILIAAGRKGVTDSLNLEAAGVDYTQGSILVNERLQTSNPDIYAVGDVTGKWQLAHAATADGLHAVSDIVGEKSYIDQKNIPACVYSRPELAAVGLTQEEAEKKGYSVTVGTSSLSANGRSLIMGHSSGFIKVISDSKKGEVLGAHMVGHRVSEMIASITMAMGTELTVEEVGATVFPHPTVSEAIMESFHDIDSQSIHNMPRK